MTDSTNSDPGKPANGVAGEDYNTPSEVTISQSIMSFTAIAWYNCIVILVLILFVFKRYSGLYFWSLLLTTLAVLPYSIGSWIKQNRTNDAYWIEVLVTVGWLVMIPGQSLVLYSRLHLITENHRLLRFILWMIIVDSVVLQPTSVILSWTAIFGHFQSSLHGYTIFEKIQMSIFTAQELFISCAYLWEIKKLFSGIIRGRAKRILWQLVAANIFIVCLDITLLTLEAVNLFMIETTFKSLVYSQKLFIEFGVLSRMINVVKSRNSNATSETLNCTQLNINSDPGKWDSSEADTMKPYNSTLGTGLSHRFSGLLPNNVDLESPPVCQESKEVCHDIFGLQQNLPTEWRLSIGSAPLAAPDLLEIQRNIRPESVDSAPSYPGRLDTEGQDEDAITPTRRDSVYH